MYLAALQTFNYVRGTLKIDLSVFFCEIINLRPGAARNFGLSLGVNGLGATPTESIPFGNT